MTDPLREALEECERWFDDNYRGTPLHEMVLAALAAPPSEEATCPECGRPAHGWVTNDEQAAKVYHRGDFGSEEATPMEQVLMQHKEHLWGCVICGVRPPSEEAPLTCAGCGHYIAGEYWHEGGATPPSEEATRPTLEERMEFKRSELRRAHGTPPSEEATGLDVDALHMDLEALRTTLPVIEGSGSHSTTIGVSMLRRLYDAALAATPSEEAG